MKTVWSVLALVFGLVLALPVAAQTNTPPNPNRGGVTFNPNGIFGVIVNEAIRQAAQQAAEEASQPAPKTKPQTKSIPVTVKKAPVFRDLPAPKPRPVEFGGRPVDFDLPHDPDKILVVLDPDLVDPDGIVAALGTNERFELALIESRRLQLGGMVIALYRIPPIADVGEVIEALRQVPGVLTAQPQYLYRGAGEAASPADMTGLQYAPQKLNALLAREAGDGSGVTIGLIDTGIDLAQPALAGADIEAFDVMAGRPVENRDHGTALAGLMLAQKGFDGIAPGARLISVRAFDQDADGAAVSASFEIASAIDLAVEKGAKVLNLSFAGPRDPLVMSVLDAAAEQGVILVAAAGNDGPEAEPAYPGAHRDAIAVTATDSRDILFAGANRGAYIAVSAPGVDVLSPLPDGRFELLSGTSIATAHVSAVVALMLAHDRDLGHDAIVSILEGSAHDLGAPGHDADYGSGLADAAEAVAAVN